MEKLKKQLKTLLTLCASVCVYKTLSSFCADQTDGFTILGISSNRPLNPRWEVHALTQEEQSACDAALHQEYYYLARGGQAFVFISADGRYIVKFFNQKVFALPFPWNFIPHTWIHDQRRIKKAWKRQNKLERDFSSYTIAFDALKRETGLVCVHLNHTRCGHPLLRIYDKLHIAHSIDLDRMEFIVQKRAELVYPHIETLMAQGKEQEAKAALSSIVRLFVTRCQKGIGDSDPDLDKNFGFIGEAAVQIDAGRFAYVDDAVAPPVIKDSFKVWLSRYPSLLSHFEQEFKKHFCN